MASMLGGDSDHRLVSHNSGEAVCQSLPLSLEACIGDEGLAFRGVEIGSTQNLCVLPVQDSWNSGKM